MKFFRGAFFFKMLMFEECVQLFFNCSGTLVFHIFLKNLCTCTGIFYSLSSQLLSPLCGSYCFIRVKSPLLCMCVLEVSGIITPGK